MGRPKKSSKPDLKVRAVALEEERKPLPQPPVTESDDENMSEEEASALIDAKVVEAAQEVERQGEELDRADWTMADPVIPEALKGRVWIAVFKCPKGHKTKATNRQAKSGIACWRCREEGKRIKAEMMPQFEARPDTTDPDLEKRRLAKKGAE